MRHETFLLGFSGFSNKLTLICNLHLHSSATEIELEMGAFLIADLPGKIFHS